MRIINWIKDAFGSPRKRAHDSKGLEKDALLDVVEAEARDLRERADMATYTLRHRDRRNHWGESIQQMITGVNQ